MGHMKVKTGWMVAENYGPEIVVGAGQHVMGRGNFTRILDSVITSG